jgi:hypothetical protein
LPYLSASSTYIVPGRSDSRPLLYQP